MMMNKKQLASAVALVIAAGVSQNAAAIWIGGTFGGDWATQANTPVKFYSEASVQATGTPINTSFADVLNVISKFGMGTTGGGSSGFIRFDFTGTKVGSTALTASQFSVSGSMPTIGGGGQPGDNFVILVVQGDHGISDAVLFDPEDKLVVTDKSGGSVAYSAYQSQLDANNKTNQLYTDSGSWFSFTSGILASCSPDNIPAGDYQLIDPKDPKKFADPAATETTIAMLHISLKDSVEEGGTPVGLDGNTSAFVDFFPNNTTYVLNGNMAAFNGTTKPYADSMISIFNTVSVANGTARLTTAAGTGLKGNGDLGDSAVGIVLTPDQVNNMVPSNYSLTVTPAAGGDYPVSPFTLQCGATSFAGSIDRADFALTPGGAYPMKFRVSNPSDKAGDVTMTVYNDDGKMVSFPLGTISTAAGPLATTLAPYASTGLIDITEVFAAAKAADPTFALAGAAQKLRVEVRSTSGENGLDANGKPFIQGRTRDGIALQVFTLATDGTSFFMTKN